MNFFNSIIITSLVASVVATFFTIYLSWIKKKFQAREEKRKREVALKLQRERMENQIYDIIDSQPMDNLILTGNEELYVMPTRERPKLSVSSTDNSFFNSMGIELESVKIEPLSACVVMPFHNRFDKIYESIKSATMHAGYSCHRSDEVFVTGDILRHIIQLILQAQVVIAVLDGNNPNVFYEVGIAHSIGKPVIFVANKNRMEKSFDLEHNRIILYNNTAELEIELSNILRALKEND